MKLLKILPKMSGRDWRGQVSVRHQGGRQKRYLRLIDFQREKFGIPARVVSIEYDPNRTANIALLIYQDGEKRYSTKVVALQMQMLDRKQGEGEPAAPPPEDEEFPF